MPNSDLALNLDMFRYREQVVGGVSQVRPNPDMSDRLVCAGMKV